MHPLMGPSSAPMAPDSPHRSSSGRDDQSYLKDHVRKEVAWKQLPLALFSNGRYFQKHAADKPQPRPLMIHWNWIKGDAAKRAAMRTHGRWLLRSEGELSEPHSLDAYEEAYAWAGITASGVPSARRADVSTASGGAIVVKFVRLRQPPIH